MEDEDENEEVAVLLLERAEEEPLPSPPADRNGTTRFGASEAARRPQGQQDGMPAAGEQDGVVA